MQTKSDKICVNESKQERLTSPLISVNKKTSRVSPRFFSFINTFFWHMFHFIIVIQKVRKENYMNDIEQNAQNAYEANPENIMSPIESNQCLNKKQKLLESIAKISGKICFILGCISLFIAGFYILYNLLKNFQIIDEYTFYDILSPIYKLLNVQLVIPDGIIIPFDSPFLSFLIRTTSILSIINTIIFICHKIVAKHLKNKPKNKKPLIGFVFSLIAPLAIVIFYFLLANLFMLINHFKYFSH